MLAPSGDSAAGSGDRSRPAPVAGCVADTWLLCAGPNGNAQTSCNTNGVGTALSAINTEQRNDVVRLGIRLLSPQTHAPPHKREQQADQHWYCTQES